MPNDKKKVTLCCSHGYDIRASGALLKSNKAETTTTSKMKGANDFLH